jgi:hypothetical protein
MLASNRSIGADSTRVGSSLDNTEFNPRAAGHVECPGALSVRQSDGKRMSGKRRALVIAALKIVSQIASQIAGSRAPAQRHPVPHESRRSTPKEGWARYVVADASAMSCGSRRQDKAFHVTLVAPVLQ